MNRIFNLVTAGLVGSVLLIGCGGSPKKEDAPAPMPVADCVFPDDGVTPAPEWVCGAPYKEYKVTAVGSYEKTGAGIDFQKTMAAASARDFLAAQMKVTVQGMVKRFTETTGAGDAETVDRVNSSVSKQITNEKLVGSRVLMTRVNPKTKTLFAIVGLDDEMIKAIAKNALQTSMNNDQAMWQQFRAKKNFDELAEEISKMQP